jgi:hypothetical protein
VIVKLLEQKILEKFGTKTKIVNSPEMTLIKVNGIDNYSLARWITEEFDGVKVTVQEQEGYKFNNEGWIKIERAARNELILTR